MSAEEILRTWQRERGLGRSVNINCGFLRSVGKTQFLRQLIEQTKTDTNNILLIVKTSNVANEYRDLIERRIISTVISRQTFRYPFNGINILVFADEVENAEQICADNNLMFIAGAYSVDHPRPQTVHHLQYERSTGAPNRNNDVFPVEAFTHIAPYSIEEVQRIMTTGLHYNIPVTIPDFQSLHLGHVEDFQTRVDNALKPSDIQKTSDNKSKFRFIVD